MSIIKIEDVAFVRFSVSDLDAAEDWFSDFGLKREARNDARLYMRGSGRDVVVYIAERGAPGFLSLGLKAGSRSDLADLSAATGRPVGPFDGPRGGEVVRLKDPDNITVEIVHGQIQMPLPYRVRPALNESDRQERLREPKRLNAGPSEVVRLGHVVLTVTNFRRSEAWYKEHFGFLTSDEITSDDGKAALGAFLRCDRGDQPTDHHTLFLLQGEKPGFNHAAFEVRDFDDLMTGHDHLAQRKYAHSWGVGRHILGSQIFDYWRDPWGNTMEHWTDGDLFTADRPAAKATTTDLLGSQWGPPFPGRL